ncbi:branched-chain amino acid transport system II carrier protein [Bacillus sonorensis]|uniref:Branched-chain amino acid transport system carrier protein n=2 Tax=Bacillus sonorensis TaxID=119858 RepID=M5PE61_9BACI|nr:branched-chain amino acid transport system II carrier protein [Bacillus sonorensis]TWK77214.1 Branched-chain amino acid transport system 2 carrier protein [Bacillus paralicheniformis]ASB87910.1 Branched-chain amino acid transport system carrier protein BrnQ [Bacillus sonorensis]EME75325.1 branched-chain amino acid transport system carrier protein BraB [Bacillus sonorensis L12]MBG9915807.1 branched-chain amino acid transporter [Bacillus sonorensis]MCF7617244.1 branched-chain amino acid trans
MKTSLSAKETIAIGLMLFALFFGAGNMIFPPQLGQAAGENVLPAIIGFLLTGVGLPLLGVIAVALTGSAKGLADKAHPVFGTILIVSIYLTIGPLFAIPRTGNVSYVIAVEPFLGKQSSGIYLFIFTLIFFGITYFLALNPSKLVDRIGKILTPILLAVIAILVIKAFITPMGEIGAVTKAYQSAPLFTGFLEGYKTMDAIASIVFAIVVITAIKERGVTNPKSIAASCIKAGIVAAAGLALVYVSLAYLGATSVDTVGSLDNGGQILSKASAFLFGSFGNVVLGVAILFACLTTSVGLVSSCGEYFSKLIPSLSYKTVVIIVSLFSLVIANFGLNEIISLSVPILSALYPLAIVVIFLSFIDKLFKERREVYIGTTLATGIFSIIDGLNAAKIPLGTLNEFLGQHIPFYSFGIGWLIPAIIGGIIGYILTFFIPVSPDRLKKVS